MSRQAAYTFADRIQAALADWNEQRLDDCSDEDVLLAFADRWRQDAALVALRAERRADELRSSVAIDEALWAKAVGLDTPEAYRGYLAARPLGQHRAEADRRLSAQDERHAWAVAETAGDETELRRFLEAWPDGKRADEARRQLMAVQNARVARLHAAAGIAARIVGLGVLAAGFAVYMVPYLHDMLTSPRGETPVVVERSVAGAVPAASPVAPSPQAGVPLPDAPRSVASRPVIAAPEPAADRAPAQLSADSLVEAIVGGALVGDFSTVALPPLVLPAQPPSIDRPVTRGSRITWFRVAVPMIEDHPIAVDAAANSAGVGAPASVILPQLKFGPTLAHRPAKPLTTFDALSVPEPSGVGSRGALPIVDRGYRSVPVEQGVAPPEGSPSKVDRAPAPAVLPATAPRQLGRTSSVGTVRPVEHPVERPVVVKPAVAPERAVAAKASLAPVEAQPTPRVLAKPPRAVRSAPAKSWTETFFD